MSERALNFNAGPATLPLPALERAQRELLDFAGTGASVMELSHRGKEYEAVHDEAIALVRELLGLPADFDVLFLQGGASMQFAQLPMNFLGAGAGSSADYVVNGVWGEKAVAEAKIAAALFGAKVRVAADTAVPTGDGGKHKTWLRVPQQRELAVDDRAAYLHFTSNETIHGVEFAVTPERPFPTAGSVPLVCDMSSDFLWRKFDASPFSLIYAGAQKNIGPSGIAMVIVRKDFLERSRKDLPKMLQYRVHAENNSLYNTPPSFGVYLVRNVLAWVKSVGGLAEMEHRNRDKARILYGAIDAHPNVYRCPVERESRSLMNVVFRLPTEALESEFVAEAKKRRMIGLKGHRSVGGIRVSTYNAVEVSWVAALAELMAEFAQKHA